MANIIDIRTADINSIPPNEIFAVDTNVLLWACYNNISHNALNGFISEYQIQFYPKFIKSLIKNRNKLFKIDKN